MSSFTSNGSGFPEAEMDDAVYGSEADIHAFSSHAKPRPLLQNLQIRAKQGDPTATMLVALFKKIYDRHQSDALDNDASRAQAVLVALSDFRGVVNDILRYGFEDALMSQPVLKETMDNIAAGTAKTGPVSERVCSPLLTRRDILRFGGGGALMTGGLGAVADGFSRQFASGNDNPVGFWESLIGGLAVWAGKGCNNDLQRELGLSNDEKTKAVDFAQSEGLRREIAETYLPYAESRGIEISGRTR